MPDSAADLPLTVPFSPLPPQPPNLDSTPPLAPDTVNDPNRTGDWQPIPETTVTATTLPDIPGFVLEKELGRGGMGVVYRARQVGLDRVVALKMILHADFAGTEQRLRFQIEAENAAHVQHPNIVQVFEIGEHRGNPYVALEYVPGGSLHDWLKQHRCPPREAATLIETLARAVHAAHLQGIVHRDLKPANILLTLSRAPEARAVSSGDEARASGAPLNVVTPKITDFGLAKRLDATAELTGSGAVMGTPTHMAPEQASGRTKHVGPAADQYALGVMLYQLLTARLPFEADTVPELLRHITDAEPVSPLRHDATVPSDLAVICLKCLTKDPTQRYPSAEALADDLRNWREHRPITARPATRWECTVKWCRRYPAVATLIVVSTLAALVASGLAVWAITERDEKEIQRQRAVVNENLAGKRLEQVFAEKDRAEMEKRIAQAVRNFLQSKLLYQTDTLHQANELLRFGGRSEEVELDPKISVLLKRAAAELTPDKIEMNFPKQPLVQAEMLHTVGSTYSNIGGKDNDRYVLAISFLERAVELRRNHLGHNHPNTLSSLNNLAGTYRHSGKLSQAITLFEQIRDTQLRELGPNHISTLVTLDNLALAYQDAGKLPQAITLFEQVNGAIAKKMGVDHSDSLIALNNLAGAYLKASKLPQAIALYEQVRETKVKKLGADHPSTLTTMGNLGAAYHEAGNLKEAITLLEYVRDVGVAKLGMDHPNTLNTLSILADAYKDAGKLPQAIALYEQIRDTQIKKFGPDHPDTLLTFNRLAWSYQTTGKLSEAITLYEQIRDNFVQKLGPDHPNTLTMLNDLATAYLDVGKLHEAISLLEQIRSIQVTKLGANHLNTLITLGNLAGAYQEYGQLPQAIALHKQVCDAFVQKLGSDHPDTLTAFNNLASAYKASGQLKEALRFWEQAAVGIEKRHFLHENVELIIPNTIRAYEADKNYNMAQKWQDKWLVVVTKTYGKAHPKYASLLSDLGLNLLRQKKWSEAEPLLRECLAIGEKKEPNAWTTFNTMSQVGTALLGQQKYNEAAPFLLQGYQGLKQREKEIPPQGKLRLVEALERLMQLYEAMGKKDEAAKWRKELDQMRSSSPPGPPKP